MAVKNELNSIKSISYGPSKERNSKNTLKAGFNFQSYITNPVNRILC